MDEQQQQQQQPNMQPKPSDGLAIASMIVGIFSLFSFCFGKGFTIVAGIVGLVLGIIAMSKKQKKGFALTGIITSAVTIGVFLIALIIILVIGVAALPFVLY